MPEDTNYFLMKFSLFFVFKYLHIFIFILFITHNNINSHYFYNKIFKKLFHKFTLNINEIISILIPRHNGVLLSIY